jgi:hypothetical protein
MPDGDHLEPTYSLIDRIVRLSLGELADFGGANYDGDLSLSLEEAQRREHDYVSEQIDIGPGRRKLDLGCGWGALLQYVRERRGDWGWHHPVVGADGGLSKAWPRGSRLRRTAADPRQLRPV